jgi:DNA-binding protein HU-beta
MNKEQFINTVAAKTSTTKKQTNALISAVLETIQEQVAAGESVDFVGFGSFTSTELKEREGRNPKTKEAITIPARISPKFKPGKGFKDLVAGVK